MNTYPFPKTEKQPTEKQPTIDDLAAALLAAKKNEASARNARIAIEEQIVEKMGVKEEGSFSLEGDHYKVTTVGKINRTLDDKQLPRLRNSIPGPLFDRLISFVAKLNLRELRFIQNNESDYYKMIAPSITSKPAKPTVSVKEIAR